MMKAPTPAIFLAATLLAGCNSLDNPVGGLLATGRDARVFNAQTGEFEWPKDQPGNKRPPGPTDGRAVRTERAGDGRYFDVAKNEWGDAPRDSAPATRAKPRLTPAPATAAPAATPPPPRPNHASGVYNASTGRIDWSTSDGAPAPTPRPRKRWWLF